MAVAIRTWRQPELAAQLPRWEEYVLRCRPFPVSRHPAWLLVLQTALGHKPLALEASEGGDIKGILPLVFLKSLLFGRFLVSLPYVNYGGVLAESDDVARTLIDQAIHLAEEGQTRYLELRHERQDIEHAGLTLRKGGKVHMHLPLPATSNALWQQLSAKVRNQIRKGQRGGLQVVWGRGDMLSEFYGVFSQNMRDLGTPVYGQDLFACILEAFGARAEFCVVRRGREAIAAALMLHGWGISEVPSAGALREHRSTNANMLMYWHLLERAVYHGQSLFDFGRSSPDSNTYRFKKQWGAQAIPANWQYYLRQGSVDDMRPENPRYRRFVRLWQRLPLTVTRWLGPLIVRGIP